MGAATFNLDRYTLERLKNGMLILDQATSGSAGTTKTLTTANVLGKLPLERIARHQARLRIVPGSVSTRPKRPSEGETVFVDFQVENAGDLAAEPAMMQLLDGRPEKGGKEVNDSTQQGHQKLPRLAPGRRLPLTLRWDPTGNAGRQTVWLYLVADYGDQGARKHNDLARVDVEAVTKARLAVGRTWPEAQPKDLEEHRLTLNAEIKNTGQTDAHNVMVSFYRSRLQTPENKLGEVEVKHVAGGGSSTASFVWDFDPLRDMVSGTQLPKPTVQIWLKGSTQRISSEAGDLTVTSGTRNGNGR